MGLKNGEDEGGGVYRENIGLLQRTYPYARASWAVMADG